MELDARACYDRIIATCAMLINILHSMPTEACQMQKDMLENASFKVQTSLGEFTDRFQHSPDSPVFGNGQGSGFSPPVWVLINSLLLDEMDQSQFHLHFDDPTNILQHDSVMVVYVDDLRTMINDFPSGWGIKLIHTVTQKLRP